MSGESTRSATANVAAFDRAFGDSATCNRCAKAAPDYRVLAVFLHDLVAVRAYCPPCYEAALEGEYHARGDGVILDYQGFTERFGAAGPPPPPTTPVDRILGVFLRDPALRKLAPPSEALARRAGKTPYHFEIEIEEEGGAHTLQLAITPEGTILRNEVHSPAAEWLTRLFG